MGIYPSLSRYYTAVKGLDGDDPKYWPVRQAMDYMRRPLIYNLRLMGHYTTRVAAVAAFDWTVNGDAGDEVLDKVRRRMTPAIKVLIENNPLAFLFGSTLYDLQQINHPELGTIMQPVLKDRRTYAVHRGNVYYYDDGGKHIGHQVIVEAEMDGKLVDYVSWLPAGAVMRGVAPVEILRHDMVLENANFLRKLKGILQIINKGSSSENISSARSAAATAIQNNYLITDDMIEFKLNDITAQGNGAFKDFIDWANKELAIAFLGQASTAELPDHGGSRAAVGVLAKLSQDIFYHDISRVTDLINKLLQVDYEMNISEGGKVPWEFSIAVPEESDIEANANALETLKRSQIPVRKQEAYSMLGLSVPAEGDELL